MFKPLVLTVGKVVLVPILMQELVSAVVALTGAPRPLLPSDPCKTFLLKDRRQRDLESRRRHVIRPTLFASLARVSPPVSQCLLALASGVCEGEGGASRRRAS